MYIAQKRIRIKNSADTYEYRLPGEAIPEAEQWRNLNLWIEEGSIRKVEEKKSEEETPQLLRKKRSKK